MIPAGGPAGAGALRIRELRFHTFGPVDLEIGPGECVGLAGPSGAGKSLLLRAVVDLDPHSGAVSLGGVAGDDLPAPLWRRRVGLLPAEPQWWHDTVGPHFAAAPPEPGLLDRLGFPADVLDWQVARLSSGERQRLGLARLLATRPQALLLDEPTASLDPASVAAVESLLADYRARHAAPVLWVSHDPTQLLRVAAREVRMESGRITSQARS